MSLVYRRREWPYSGSDVELVSDGLCDGPHYEGEAEAPRATLAHAGFELVAQVLAAPIRKAYWEHFDQSHIMPRLHCPECLRLEALMTPEDRPVWMA